MAGFFISSTDIFRYIFGPFPPQICSIQMFIKVDSVAIGIQDRPKLMVKKHLLLDHKLKSYSNFDCTKKVETAVR